jgi:hypothetical protein
MEGNPDPMDLTIVVGANGGLRMIANSDWPLESVQSWHGAEMVYRVRRHGNAVRLEGRAGSRTCLFESRTLNGAASGSSVGRSACLPATLLPPMYEVVPPRL